MHKREPRPADRRRGKILIMTALMLPASLGMVALGVDSGVLAMSKSQLRTATDSAALAGAAHLATTARLQVGPVTSGDVSAARSKAVEFASYNKVFGVSTKLASNASNANTGAEDVVFGYSTRPFDATKPLLTDAAWLPYFNTVLVRASRTKASGGQVPAQFSAIWGRAGTDMTAMSAATVVGVSGFKSTGSANAICLPIVLDKATFTAMIKGQTTDQYGYNAGSNTVTNGGDGIAESKLYPVSNGSPGNWGTIKIGVSNNSTSTLGAQIRYGITPAQLATYPSGTLQPDPATGHIVFEGNPGISAGIKDDLTSIIGKPVQIPIYDPALSGGNGNNAYYTVIAFAPVRIVKVVFQGSDKHVIVQPAPPPSDPTVVWGGLRSSPMTGQYRLVLTR